jgi:DNA polymerase III gamma/tau subunit
MDPESIVRYLHLHTKGWTAQEIHDDLVATLGEEAIEYSMVTMCLREAQINPADAISLLDATSHHLNKSDEVVLRVLEELQFSSVRQLVRAIHLPAIMIYRRISKKLGFAARHLR